MELQPAYSIVQCHCRQLPCDPKEIIPLWWLHFDAGVNVLDNAVTTRAIRQTKKQEKQERLLEMP